jgi:hypothetical protein
MRDRRVIVEALATRNRSKIKHDPRGVNAR